MIASPGNLNYLTKHGINARGRRIRFSNKSKYGVIIYDKEQALFFSHDDKLIKQLKMSELSAEKIQALKDLKNGIYTYSRDRPKQELVDNWTNPQEYMVVIDGELIENSMMTQYKADDFSFQLLIKLRRSDPEKAKYRVDLFTNNFFDKLVSAQEKLGLELVSTNNELMNLIDK